jgi:hypothetical protein
MWACVWNRSKRYGHHEAEHRFGVLKSGAERTRSLLLLPMAGPYGNVSFLPWLSFQAGFFFLFFFSTHHLSTCFPYFEWNSWLKMDLNVKYARENFLCFEVTVVVVSGFMDSILWPLLNIFFFFFFSSFFSSSLFANSASDLLGSLFLTNPGVMKAATSHCESWHR